ncbi:15010_t:CDS:1, partial [Cetraspora pellucida]
MKADFTCLILIASIAIAQALPQSGQNDQADQSMKEQPPIPRKNMIPRQDMMMPQQEMMMPQQEMMMPQQDMMMPQQEAMMQPFDSMPCEESFFYHGGCQMCPFEYFHKLGNCMGFQPMPFMMGIQPTQPITQ